MKFIANKKSKNYFEVLKNQSIPHDYTKYISLELKIPSAYVDQIIICLLNKNIICKDSDNIYIFNENICNEKIKIDLTKKIKINKKDIDKEIEYDKDNIIDCYLIRIVKKENIDIEKYIVSMHKEINSLFVPSEDIIKNRLQRMIKLGYINYNKDDSIYSYIP